MRADRPSANADPRYLDAFAEVMRRIEASVDGAARQPIVACIAGGAAVHWYTGARISSDIDAKIMARFVPPKDLSVTYRDALGCARMLYFDTQYNDTLGLLHPDAYDAAISVKVDGVDPAKLDVRMLTPLDLAVSKLGRYEVHDQGDIAALARAGLIDGAALRQRAEEALPDYIGDVQRVKTSIKLAAELIDRERSS